MGLKKTESQVKTMLEDTILALCRNTLSYHADISIEGLIGVTLDQNEIFLVNINQSFKRACDASDEDVEQVRGQKQTMDVDEDGSSSSSCEDTNPDGKTDTKRRKRKRRKRNAHGFGCDMQDQSKYFDHHNDNDKENGCGRNSENNQHTDMNGTECSAHMLDAKMTDQAEDLRRKDHDLATVKEEASDIYHLGTPFANVHNAYNNYSTGYEAFNSPHAIPAVASLSPGPSSSFTSPTPLSPSQNIPMGTVSSPRPPIARKSTASPRRSSGTSFVSMKTEDGSPTKATCQLCGRVCVSRSKLVIHMRVHTGEKPFICFICGRGCVQKSDLKKHIRTVHKMFIQQ